MTEFIIQVNLSNDTMEACDNYTPVGLWRNSRFPCSVCMMEECHHD